MKRALLVFATVLALQAQAQTRQLFDHGWQFTREGKTITVDLPHDRHVITADGLDLAFITIEVVDKQGWVCPDAAIPCEAITKGQGTLLAFASADLKDREIYTSPRVTTWKGRALLVVRSSQKQGKVQVSVKSSLPTATLTVQTVSPCRR